VNIELHLSTALIVWLDLLRILVYAMAASYLLYLLLMLVFATVEFLRTRAEDKSSWSADAAPARRASAPRGS
jgi:hypothetical protein